MAPLPETISRQEAKERGLKRYFTGNPCKHGHISPRATHNAACIVCVDIASDDWRRRNAEVINNARRERYCNDQEYRAKVIETSAIVRAKSEYSRKASYRWWARNKERAAEARRAYSKLNRGKMNAARRAYYARERAKLLALNANCRAKRLMAEGTHTAADISRIMKMQRSRCAWCSVRLGAKYHKDHIQPLALGGTNWAKNIQLLCQPCNNRKSAKDPIVWARQNGRLI